MTTTTFDDECPFGEASDQPRSPRGLGVQCDSCLEEATFRWDNGRASCYGCGYGDAGWGDDWLREQGLVR